MSDQIAVIAFIIVDVALAASFVGVAVVWPIWRYRRLRQKTLPFNMAIERLGPQSEPLGSSLINFGNQAELYWRGAVEKVSRVARTFIDSYLAVTVHEENRHYIEGQEVRSTLPRLWRQFANAVDHERRVAPSENDKEALTAYGAAAELVRLLFVEDQPGGQLSGVEAKEQFLASLEMCAMFIEKRKIVDAQAKASDWLRLGPALPKEYLPALLFFYGEIMGISRKSEVDLDPRASRDHRRKLVETVREIARDLRSNSRRIHLEDLANAAA